jgi:hypothetical protein
LKVIHKDVDTSDTWYIGDVIEFKANRNSKGQYAMIIENTKDIQCGVPPVVTTVVLSGAFHGDFGFMKAKAWQDGAWCIGLDELQKNFEDSCYQVKKVPFYGVVGKPEED